MAGNYLAYALPGQNAAKPSAKLQNLTVDVAREYQRRRAGGVNGRSYGLAEGEGLVTIKNASGDDRGRFDILGIDSILIAPGDNLAEYQNNWALSGKTPTSDHVGKFVVCAEPIADGKVGRAWLTGVCPVLLSSTGGATTARADVDPTDPTRLMANPAGSAQVLYQDTGTSASGETADVRWALVRLGNPAAGDVLCRITGPDASGGGMGSYTCNLITSPLTSTTLSTLTTSGEAAKFVNLAEQSSLNTHFLVAGQIVKGGIFGVDTDGTTPVIVGIATPMLRECVTD